MILALLAIVLAAAAARAENGKERRFIPHIALSSCSQQGSWNPFAKGCWETEVIFRNRSQSPAEVSLFWHGPFGASFPVWYRSSTEQTAQELTAEQEPMVIRLRGLGVASYTFTLPPAQGGFWKDLFDLSPRDQTGWMVVEIEMRSSDQGFSQGDDLEIFAVYRFKKRGKPTNQAYARTVLPALGFSTYVRRSAGDLPSNVGFALANPNGEEAIVRFVIRDREGKEMKLLNPFPVRIVPHGQLARMMDELIPMEAKEIEGTLEMTANIPIVAIALQVTGKPEEAVLSTIPLTPSKP